jgi:hypothetical protein
MEVAAGHFFKGGKVPEQGESVIIRIFRAFRGVRQDKAYDVLLSGVIRSGIKLRARARHGAGGKIQGYVLSGSLYGGQKGFPAPGLRRCRQGDGVVRIRSAPGFVKIGFNVLNGG